MLQRVTEGINFESQLSSRHPLHTYTGRQTERHEGWGERDGRRADVKERHNTRRKEEEAKDGG